MRAIIAEVAAAWVLAAPLLASGQSAQGHGGYRGPSTEQPVLSAEQKARLAQTDAVQDAVVKKDAAALQRLIRGGLSMNFNFDEAYRGRSSESPLTMAIGRGHLEIARMLLDSGADPNRRDGFDNSAMNRATSSQAVELLLNHGADINAGDKRGMTALALAIERRDAAAAEMLAARGARPDAPKGGPDLFTLAVQRDNLEAVRALLARGADPRSPPTQALWLLIEKGDGDTARLLLDKGADPSADNGRETLLERALFRSRWDIVRSLVEAGAKLQPPDGPACVPSAMQCHAIQAARFASLDPPTLAFLKSRGLDLDRRAANEHTVLTSLLVAPPGLRIAAQLPDGRITTPIEPPDEVARVRALLEQGADPNKPYRELTPLMLAVAVPQKPRALADVVFEFGGRVKFEHTMRKPASEKPAVHALPASSTAAVEIASEVPQDSRGLLAGMTVGPASWLAGHGRPDLAARMMARDGKVDRADRNLLYFAAQSGQWDLALETLKQTHDANVSDRAGVTPLMLAADDGRADAVKALLAAGAKVNARSDTDWPPLWETPPAMWFGGHSPSKPRLVGGYTALKAAKERGHADVVKILEQAGGRE